MGGVINLITKKGDGDLFVSVGGDAGSFDYYKGQLSTGGEVNDRLRFHLTGSYEDTMMTMMILNSGPYTTPASRGKMSAATSCLPSTKTTSFGWEVTMPI